jgi:hypothetical protein
LGTARAGFTILQATFTAICVVHNPLKRQRRGFGDRTSPSANTSYEDSLSVRGSARSGPGIPLFSAAGCAPLGWAGSSKSLSDARLSLRLFTWPIRYPPENLCANQKLRSPRISGRFRTFPRSTEKPDQTTSGVVSRSDGEGQRGLDFGTNRAKGRHVMAG